MTNKKKLLLLGGFLVLAISVPLTLSRLDPAEKIETRSRASGSATLSFTPGSSTTQPIQKQINDTIGLDLMVDPGTHSVSFIQFQLTYDPTKLELATSNPFTVNQTSFPTTVEGPIVGDAPQSSPTLKTIAMSVSVGSDPTKTIRQTTKVGTVNFKAIGPTGDTPTLVTFTDLTDILSTGASDSAGQNVLSTTAPAAIVIGGTGGTTTSPTQPPTGGDGPLLSFDLLLHGIGSAGDNPNPTGSTLSNKNPIHPQRNLVVQVYNSTNQLVSSTSGTIDFDSTSGTFKGKVGTSPQVTAGNYTIRIKSDRYLRRLIPGVQNIDPTQETNVPRVEMIAGDTNNDNKLNILDYNAFLDCGYGSLNPLPLEDPKSIFNTDVCQSHKPVINIDLDDNGVVNSPDYNLFLRELSVQSGD